ncbi:hypothetical protein F511_33593 [Dorcoceras hygrometricum]|uniref:Uncharacterized protein n=1 Tax=Dorcoceras hygrometricum TaxID=472368 RepID=A0A2Z7D7W3_9LAMI|nr:hypothetical protein F511_33593 [Dorcoceras hygrometricum]
MVGATAGQVRIGWTWGGPAGMSPAVVAGAWRTVARSGCWSRLRVRDLRDYGSSCNNRVKWQFSGGVTYRDPTRFDKLERSRGVHCFVSADEVFSRYFVEVVQQLLSLFVEDCDTTSFGLVGTTAFCLIQQKRSFCQISRCTTWNQQMQKRVCISADEFFQAFFQSKFLTTTMDVSADYQIGEV